MKALVVCALVLAAGCANVTTMKLSAKPDGTVAISSGKDVHARVLDWKQGETTIHIEGYSSDASAAAIAAQADREVRMTQAITEAILKALAAGAEAAK